MDADVYDRQGFGGRLELVGRAALLVVDFTVGFADPAVYGGGNVAAAVNATIPVLKRCRELGLPIAFSRIVYAGDGSDRNVFSTKLRGLDQLTDDSPVSGIVPALAPAAGELVVRKTAPSAFFGTPLAAWLVERGVQSLLVAGATTSGCVRASVVDAMSYGFRPFVLSDCVGDRALGPHEASLFDIQQKYGEVLESTIAVGRLGDQMIERFSNR